MKRKFNYHALHMRQIASSGFTLVELLVVITIATILAVAAVPILQSLPANARLQEKTQRLSSQLQQARSEAIRGNRIVYVCALQAKSNLQVQGCNSTPVSNNVYDWSQGTLIYADDLLTSGKSVAKYDTGEHISHVVFDKKTVEVRTSTAQITFMPTGRTRSGQALTFTFRDSASGSCRTVLVDPSGRARSCKTGETDCDKC